MQPTSAPPGWYFDGQGYRWWDGANWSVYASPMIDSSSDEAGKNMAIIANLSALIGGFLGPLIVYLLEKDKNDFARHHAREALNFQLTYLVVFVGAILTGITTMAVSIDTTSTSNAAPWGAGIFVMMWLLAMVAGIANFVLTIIGAIRANRLERWTYPVRIGFVRH